MNEYEASRQDKNGRATKAVAGMRGGLGRILLTAFMLLAIVPLSVVSYLAVRRVQGDMRQAAIDHLTNIVASNVSHLQAWLDAQQYGLSLLAQDDVLLEAMRDNGQRDICGALQDCPFSYVALVPAEPVAAGETGASVSGSTGMSALSQTLALTVPVESDAGRTVALLVGFPDLHVLSRITYVGLPGEDIRLFLAAPDGRRWSLSQADQGGEGHAPIVVGSETGGRFYENPDGESVLGVYQWVPEWGVALWAEQPEAAVLAREDDLAAMLIGSTLAVALLTAVLAAVITRQLTQPIVDLTMSAVKIAGGDLTQTVDLDRRDEIGILARAFNIMTTELRSLYAGLEQKVAERTQQLTEANRELRYKAMQLRLSAEVGRVATSILDPDLLLRRVTELVLETYAHVYDVYYVAILLQDEFGERLERQACSGRRRACELSQARVADGSLIGQTAANGKLRSQHLANGAMQVVIPLRIGSRVIGSLDLHCSRQDTLRVGGDDIGVLQSLGDQISVAIENARLYAIEREAVQRLSKLDDLRLASLGVGSRELATELNTIIGFSRLILKEADGPLTELQRADLVAIYKSGYKLLGLIDNVITLSELESGATELDQQPVDLTELLDQILATARQRLPDVAIEWQCERTLPLLRGDASLLRQAFLSLATAAAELVPQERVTLTALVGDEAPEQVTIYVGNRDSATTPYQAERCPSDQEIEEMGVGVALARDVIRLHGGEVQFQFDVERGLDCIVSLLPVEQERLERP
jgi:signal transduction histidine kinase